MTIQLGRCLDPVHSMSVLGVAERLVVDPSKCWNSTKPECSMLVLWMYRSALQELRKVPTSMTEMLKVVPMWLAEGE